MKTTHVRATDVEERWLLYDASEHTLGRMATQIAQALMGKDRPTWTPSELSGAHGLKEVKMEDVLARRPNDVVTLAVRRMLPKTRLGHRMLKRLKVYPGGEHPHAAQKPTLVEASS